ncbi:tryptophan synthase subunit alpha [Pseudidiomarina sp. GXY010]|uniref:Tryptophan synthase alpha chain n=1 Tax=Pseudidiomarina fusca TaxID=2965078 RepID=A0ABU3KVI1_9GAMM|nr:tryptophan synthase subunit alpha [Pseudidiomarina sp. GXY010]MDT7525503.1 tryptophan synthase subunit alpha [Pseudidiomarina sp. GXY010]
MSRYQAMFADLAERQQGAFVPFVTLGDPNLEQSFALIQALVEGGADALELGLPFSDPVADGPTIQRANIRALQSNVSVQQCFALLAKIRALYPNLPIGLLVYANLVESNGAASFYQRCADAGVDSVLIADVPSREGERFAAVAKHYGIAPIFIAPSDGTATQLQRIAALSEGYVYLLSRAGVTGAETSMQTPTTAVIEALQQAHSAPPLLGFGIAKPEHVQAALAAGAAGAISGSAVVQIIEQNLADSELMLTQLRDFSRQMKAATNKP